MNRLVFLPPPIFRRLVLLLAFALAAPAIHAHRAYEITTVGRLQHGRLELTVTLSLVMANYLLKSDASPEAGALAPENFDARRESLLRLAPAFLELRDGGQVLRPEKILVALNASGEPEFAFIYPLPSQGSLHVRTGTLRAPGREGLNIVRLFDDDERFLGGGLLGPEVKPEELTIPLPPRPGTPADAPAPPS